MCPAVTSPAVGLLLVTHSLLKTAPFDFFITIILSQLKKESLRQAEGSGDKALVV